MVIRETGLPVRAGLIRVPVIGTPSRITATRPTATHATPTRPATVPQLFGFATPFGVQSGLMACNHSEYNAARATLIPGVFDGWLAAVRRRERVVRLLVNHDAKTELASTADFSLIVWADRRGLWFACNRASRRGGTASAFLAARPSLRHCSPGFTSTLAQFDPQAGGSVSMTVAEAELNEISLVSKPAFAGTYVRLR